MQWSYKYLLIVIHTTVGGFFAECLPSWNFFCHCLWRTLKLGAGRALRADLGCSINVVAGLFLHADLGVSVNFEMVLSFSVNNSLSL